MAIYSTAVKKPITTIMVFAAIIVMGVYSLNFIPVDMYPEVDPPYITVLTSYVGANAEEIETNVTQIIEDGLNTVDELKEITSESQDNMSIITLEFDWESDLTEAMNNVRDALDMIKSNLPDDSDDPLLFKFSSSMMPVLFYAIEADESFDGLEKIIDKQVVNTLNRVGGIGSISILGAPGRRIYVDCDPQKLEAYGLTIAQVSQVIAAENKNTPSGHIKMGSTDYQLRVEGEFNSSDVIQDLVVSRKNGRTIYVKDIAEVNDKGQEIEMINRFGGRQGMRMMIMKQSGANTVAVANGVKEKMEAIMPTLPKDIKFTVVMDSSEDIMSSISNLSQTFIFALLFVMLVVLMFLGRWRATFIIVLTIPISLIVAFTYLYISGGSINIISLSSLSIAIGMVVDDAIVVLENIMKHIERGASPREAAIYATKEVWLSVIATTLVVVAVFFPLTLVGGQTGIFFKQLGWIVTITVVTSTLAAITLTPMLSSKMLRLRKENKGEKTFYERTFLRALNVLDNSYGKLVAWVITHKKIVFPVSLIIFLGSLMLTPLLKFENMPEQDLSAMTVNFELQPGSRVEKTDEVAKEVEAFIKQTMDDEVKLVFTSSGSDDEGGISSIFGENGTHVCQMRMRLENVEYRKKRGKSLNKDLGIWTLADTLRSKLASIPEIANYTVSTNTQGMGGGSNAVNVEVYGYDFDATTQLAMQIADSLRKVDGAEDVQISRERMKPQYQVVFNQDDLAEFGLTTAAASSAVRNAIAGVRASRFREDGEEYDIMVRYAENARMEKSDLENILIQSPINGKLIKVSDVGTVEDYWATPKIERKLRQRYVTVSATPAKGMVLSDLAEVAERIKANVEKDVPTGVSIEVGGAYEDMQENNRDLSLLFVMIIILVFIVMASQFESLIMPFIIMSSIAFSFSGVIIALLITNTTASMIAILGGILLVGIVVKNGIVLIDYLNLLRERGIELHKATIMASKSRLRPILMTAMTTVLGMLPMALSVTEGSEVWAPMGITVIGGLVFSTLITLILTPALYVLFARRGERDRRASIHKKFNFLDN